MLTWQKNNLFQGKQIYVKRELEILYQFVNLTTYTNIAVFFLQKTNFIICVRTKHILKFMNVRKINFF